ncbi:MAG TPA: hypothetical protein VII44_01875 [Puia sp.]
MKKVILSIAILLALTGTSFANNTGNINERAIASFQMEFRQASEVEWAVTNDYIMATFQMDKQVLFAYYDFQGNLIGLVHHMLTNCLPVYLQKDIKKHYGNYWVTELFQITGEEGVYYYIQLKNADETIVLSTEGTNIWHRYTLPRNKTTNL